jgi:type I restriction enzyme M protein
MIDVVSRLWGFCHTLRHDGIDYGDYIEQITYLLFLKMADERKLDLHDLEFAGADGKVAKVDCSWPRLRDYSGTLLLDHYTEFLRVLGRQPGILGDIYSGAQSRFNNPVNLKRLVGLIDELEWTSLNVDVKAAAYEGLLEKAASEGKKGAGQYFTPRILIQSIVRCMKPDPRTSRDFTVADPACGSGGFLVVAYEWFIGQSGAKLDREVAKRVKKATYHGQELVHRPRRLALMNLYLHGIEPDIRLADTIDEPPGPGRYDVVLTNPPFGTKGAGQAPDRDDFTIRTSNKQLNFLQHVLTVLKPGGRAVFEILTQDCDLHTVLRLPRGTFTPYCQGVKANVIYFTKGRPTERVWIYDGRTNVPGITKKDRPLTDAHFAGFEACYGDDPNGQPSRSRRHADSAEDRWRSFSIEEVKAREFKLDGFKWLKDDSLDDADGLPEPEELVTDAVAELMGAIEELNLVMELLGSSDVEVEPTVGANP